MDNYLNNDIMHPTYLFHGSPKLLEVVEQRQAHDSNGVKENEDYAVFLTSSFIIASAYAFKDSIKKISDGLNWSFDISYDFDTDQVDIRFENVNLDDNLEGYIYVFPFSKEYEHKTRSIQYKCYENIKPIDAVKVKFSDFNSYYQISQTEQRKKAI